MTRRVLLLGLALAVVATGCRIPVIASHRPDLVVASVGDPPADGSTVESFALTVSTDNTGVAAANRSVTRVFLSLDDQLDVADAVLGEVTVPRLRAGSPPNVASVEATVPASVQPVAYHVLACADATHRVKERNEQNNCRASTGTISFAPSPPPPPPPGEGSSQMLIAQDLEAGLIDYGTSLVYRAWTLFWDPRLPERYDGTGSTGEDQALFPAIAAALPNLPPEQQAELEGFLVRPTDPRSPFGPAATAAGAMSAAAAAAGPELTKCMAPKAWYSQDWPRDNSDTGFRAWVCERTSASADVALASVIATAAKVWGAMTVPVPNGMGVPAPDTSAPDHDSDGLPDNDGNGKIDVYLLATNQCRDRGGVCEGIVGKPIAEAAESEPCNRDVPRLLPGFPLHACSGFILLSRRDVERDASFVHEFFHVLQSAHNSDATYYAADETFHWYVEASADWAEWYYAKSIGYAPTAPFDDFKMYQKDNVSLLEERRLGSENQDHAYASWVWPLFQTIERGASNIFSSWSVAESANNHKDLDAALADQLSFKDTFRDFAVRNLQPVEYRPTGSSGLEKDWWQAKPDLAEFPLDAHAFLDNVTLGLGGAHSAEISQQASVEPLGPWYARVEVTDPDVRQITIDLRALRNVATADLDVVGRLVPVAGGPADPWRRIPSNGDVLTLCRDEPTENFKLIYVVISNHSTARIDNRPDYDANVGGNYTVKAKDACDVPDHYDVTFSGFNDGGDSWSGTATYDKIGAASNCDDPANFPPGANDLVYCYALVQGKAAWDYANPTIGATGTLPAILRPPDDSGGITLVSLNPDPLRVRTYDATLFPAQLAHVMSTSLGGRRDAANAVIAWVATYPTTPGQFNRIGGGYQLAGSAQLCAGAHACQGWTWDFVPRWDD